MVSHIKDRNSLKVSPISKIQVSQNREIMYTPVEVAIVTHFYASQQINNKKFSINEIFDFSSHIMRKIEDLPITTSGLYKFSDMLLMAKESYKKAVTSKMN